MNRLSEIIEEEMAGRSVEKSASDWGVPYWIVRDARYKGTCPGPLHLIRMAKGMGRDIEELALAADQPAANGNGNTPPQGD